MRHKLVSLIAVLQMLTISALAESAAGQSISLSPFQKGLAEQMREAAQGLNSAKRYQAMDALNRARHLAAATASAVGLKQEAGKTFQAAENAVKRARGVLQNGRPEQASAILERAADALDRASLGAAKVPPQGVLQEASGRTVLSASGSTIGTLRGIGPGSGGGIEVRISTGGMLGIGSTEHTVSTTDVIIGRTYVALVEP